MSEFFRGGSNSAIRKITGQSPNKLTRAIDAASEKVYFLSVGVLFSGRASQPAL